MMKPSQTYFHHCYKWFFLINLIALLKIDIGVEALEITNLKSLGWNSSTLFRFHNPNMCRRNEFYDLDYFACSACREGHTKLQQPIAEKFACKCPETMITIYEPTSALPKCIDMCSIMPSTDSNALELEASGDGYNNCSLTTHRCRFRYVNQTTFSSSSFSEFSGYRGTNRFVNMANININDANSDCISCDPTYNFQYQSSYCIANSLLKPYLHYNSFWQTTSNTNNHFGELKFVAFFCLTLHNATSCNQLANLCVQSFYSLDKNSPCSGFLLTQVSDMAMKYASTSEQLRDVRPFLFYPKGKATAKMLSSPIEGINFKLSSQEASKMQRLHFVSTTFALDGSLKRFGSFSLAQVNLCQLHTANSDNVEALAFAQYRPQIKCQLTLENLIDLARIYGNDNFINLYLNFSRLGDTPGKEVYLQQIPVLIENLTPENRRVQREDWQLVKRFQLFELHQKPRFGLHGSVPSYEDRHKLLLYRSLRYVESFELNYDIHTGNRISMPIIKLRMKSIEFLANTSLTALYPFTLRVTFSKFNEGSRRQLLMETALPILMLLALVEATLRANNSRRRRGTLELCDISCFFDFLLRLVSNVAYALLYGALLLIVFNSLEFLTQRTVKITLPLIKHSGAIECLIVTALMLKFIFVIAHLWRVSHYDLFLLDWERPRSCDNNHFNLKNNFETSSVCSSVRTYVAENNVSAWRILFTANEWIRLSTIQKYSTLIQAFVVLITFQVLDRAHIIHQDRTLQTFFIVVIYAITYVVQLFVRQFVLYQIFGNPLQKFIDLCSLSNISVFTLLEPSFGYYIHGRSPHGFADTDMSSIITQLQREAQNMCGRRGLLSDSDKQVYVIVPPKNFRIYLERLLVPFQRSCNTSQSYYQKEIHTIDGSLERTTIAYASVNRFFCAFIDHAIKDMDYIIKEKVFLEKLFDFESENYLTENKGTFYIDSGFSFGRLTLIGNDFHLLILEFLLLISIFLLTSSLVGAITSVCFTNLIIRSLFRHWVRRNVSRRTLIDQRFLM